MTPTADVEVSIDGHVAVVEIQRPPHNYFDCEHDGDCWRVAV